MNQSTDVKENYGVQRGPPDLSHHFSSEARKRQPNPMKEILRLVKASGKADRIANMSNGDPHHSLYPFRKIMFEIPSINTSDPVPAWREGSGLARLLGSYKEGPSTMSLIQAFQYTHGAGLVPCQQALTNLTKFFHNPPNHAVTLTLGNSDGITKAFRLLGEKGDYFLTDELSFTSMTNAPLSYGVQWVGIKMDKAGIIPEDMERILNNWDEYQRGKRPHVLYTVPVGQNPTGITLSWERRRKIYAIAQKWDLIIIEDDPYFFLQYDLPVPETRSTEQDAFSHQFARSLTPSFVSMDVDGRVIRIDSFSKIIAPGMRFGWITSNPAFHEAVVTYTDSATQHPHAFGQIFVTELLGEHGWKIDGFCRWVWSLCRDYQRRRDFLVDIFRREIEPTGLATISVPQSGMFVWITVNYSLHPRYRRYAKRDFDATAPRTNIEALSQELFQKMVDCDVVLMPASIFAIEESPSWVDIPNHVPLRDRINGFRATFAGTEETIEKGIINLNDALRKFFEVKYTAKL